MATLAEQLQALSDEHGLTCIRINFSARDGGSFYTYVHAGDLCRGGGDAPTPQESLDAAIRAIVAARTTEVSVPVLEAA